MNTKKYLVGSALLLCSLLTACSAKPKVEDNTSEGLEQLKADGFIALNNNDKEDAPVAVSKDGRFSYTTNNVNGITLVADGVETNGELIIPETIDGHRVTKIGRSAYADSNITKVVIPANVKIIEDLAFAGCTSLTEVVLGADVVEVGESSFQNCYNLEKIELNEGLYRLGHSAFAGCYDLTSIKIPNSVELIDKYCFTNSGLKEVTLPEKLYYVAEGTFMGCSDLKKVKLNDTLAIIDHLAFADCPILETEVPEGCGKVCKTAFKNSSTVSINPATLFEHKELKYEGDFSEFENPQIVRYFYTEEMESTSNE